MLDKPKKRSFKIRNKHSSLSEEETSQPSDKFVNHKKKNSYAESFLLGEVMQVVFSSNLIKKAGLESSFGSFYTDATYVVFYNKTTGAWTTIGPSKTKSSKSKPHMAKIITEKAPDPTQGYLTMWGAKFNISEKGEIIKSGNVIIGFAKSVTKAL